MDYIFVPDSMGLSSFKFSWWAEKDARVLKQCIIALKGHPRSLILAPIESVYATSYWSSIVTSVLSCPVSEILLVFCWEERPPIQPEFGGGPFGLDCWCCGSYKLIIRAINFQLVQPICPRYLNVRYRRTDGRLTIATSRGKNCYTVTVHLSTKHIKHRDTLLIQPNEQLSSLFSVAQTPRLLVVELMFVYHHVMLRQLSVQQQDTTIVIVR